MGFCLVLGLGLVFFGLLSCVLSSGQGKKDEFSDLAIKLHSNTLLLGNNFQGVSY